MTLSSPEQIVTAYQDAWTARRFDAARELVAGDIAFQSPQQSIKGATEFFTMLALFAGRIEPRWELLSATTDGDAVLALYNLFVNGTPAPCADYFTVVDGKIQSEVLVFDPKPFAQASKTG